MLTALHVATDINHQDVMDTLLRLGAKVNALDALGQTGLYDLVVNFVKPTWVLIDFCLIDTTSIYIY